MAEDLVENLNTYNEQLKQVEAALTNDPTDAELLKLKKDLVEVIELTNDLIRAQAPAATSQDSAEQQEPIRNWEVGDRCSAVWAEDGLFYNAMVDEITSDGQVMVHFVGFKSAEVTRLSQLREPLAEDAADEDGADAAAKFGRKGKNQQEYLKRKKQKKVQRFKEMEEVREQEKSKWQQFNNKVKKRKNVKGYTKSSIFKTPEAVNGKVGVGTCGIGGKPMTSYTTADKWKRGV
ncbi:survival of motor neuron-related-splicing factor 30-like [Pollicipes pollicipes]|uniref:survival of motor neuron-related-splicing factor 30-like n=1 Tax=Pollicipes pollicipes TaxID=41117 RepID=UPI0018855FFE|nr:survival of motor neuron-related-splicing factor 30-like [Pollicipes pollicipes]